MNSPRAESPVDRAEILELIARFAWALDEGRADSLALLLTPDAQLVRISRDGTRQQWAAADGLQGFIDDRRRVAAEDRQTWCGDAVFSREEDGGVRVVSNSLRIATMAGGTSNVLLGDEEIDDRFVRGADGWRLRSRTMIALGAPRLDRSALVTVEDSTRMHSDRIEIEALFADYAWALDTADIDAVLDLFSLDAVMQDPFGRFTGRGPNGIGRFFEGLFARAEFAGRIHWVSQLTLTPIPEGYQADSYAIVPASYVTGAVNLHLVAFYRDTIVREEGAWRFRERLVGPRWERGSAEAPVPLDV